MKTFVDRDFEYHRAIAQVWLQLSLRLADAAILPFSCPRFADKLARFATDFEAIYGETLLQQSISLGEEVEHLVGTMFHSL